MHVGLHFIEIYAGITVTAFSVMYWSDLSAFVFFYFLLFIVIYCT